MKKKLNKIDKIVFYGYISILILSLFLAFIFDSKNKFVDIKYAFQYCFIGLFQGTLFQSIIVCFVLIAIIGFVIGWYLGTKKVNKYSFGSIYFISFFILFLISNGYYNALNRFSLGIIMLIIAFSYCFISTIYSFISYYLTIKEMENENE